jgi:hypothetical protein
VSCDREQDRLGVVAQRDPAHGRRRRQERARERLPVLDDAIHLAADEAGERQRLGAPRQVQQAFELALHHRVAFAGAAL